MVQTANSETTPGEGPIGGWDAYLAAVRAYPAGDVPPAVAAQAQATFDRIASDDAKKGDPGSKGRKWSFFGPTQAGIQPGVLAFSGATNQTASRTTAMLVDPYCNANKCRIWVGASGGGVWRTDNALTKDPNWKQLHPGELDQTSVGTLAFDPTDKTGNTIYLGTGEANRCSSGCEAGVGIYKSTDNGENWTKLDAACVSNSTYPCMVAGNAFLGRGIRSIVVDPRNANHIFVGSALAVRGLSHVIGNGGTTRIEPSANLAGLYESTDGGKTFTMVWDGAKPDTIPGLGAGSYGVTDLALDPLNPNVIYVAAFDAGLWRRDAGAAQTAFTQVFKPQFNQGVGIDRLMFALTVKNGKTRIYLTDGTQPATANLTDPLAANFWRLDKANQPAASCSHRSQRAHGAGSGDTHLPRDIQRLAVPDVESDGQSVLRDHGLLHPAVLVRPTGLYAGRDARHRLRDRVEPVRRAAVRHEWRRLRKRSLQRPRGPLLRHRRGSGRLSDQSSNLYRPVVRCDDRPPVVVRVRAVRSTTDA